MRDDREAGGLVLGIDTCTDLLGIGLLDAGRTIGSTTVSSRSAHSETLLPALAALLEEAGRRVEEIALLGVIAGPGRFTSLRIGLATAQGLAFGLGIPVVPVPALEALAVAAESAPPVAAVLDGGGAGIYAGIFDVEGLAARPILPSRFESPADLAVRARGALAGGDRPLAVVGSGSARAAAALEAAGLPAAVVCWTEIGASVARLAAAHAAEAIDPADLTPIYLRPTQAEERHAGSARVLDRADAT